ncbi:MAG: Xaa-Pro peptidase family protein [Chloroflexi bacterium]|nr:Xaa-Pro peptidase family protein [Chloroflexota bacterium]
MTLYREKAAQATALLAEVDLDCWLTFARETVVSPDPGVEMAIGVDVTWNSAFLFFRDGRRVAIVGRYDVPDVRLSGIFDEVIGYDEGLRASLVATLERHDPQHIGLNYSVHDKTADGLTHGMWRLLQELLDGTPYPARFTSAERLLGRLRARKTPAEVARIRGAITETEEIVAMLAAQIVPGVSEAALGAFVHAEFHRRGLPSAWSWQGCPIVNSGPESDPGHAAPRDDILVAPGHLVHVDLGVRREGYCSDIQRMWYVRRPGEQQPPAEIERAFAVVLQAIDAGAAALRPGVRGFEVDAVAREVIVEGGFEEYRHAFGHGLGRACHDGGPLLGPRWERYGNTPDMQVEVGHVYTLELGVVTSAGYLGLEEDVLVTEDGCVFLSTQQRTLGLV